MEIKNLVQEELKKVLKEAQEKWMQKASKDLDKGGLHKDLGISQDKEIPMSLINKKIKELHAKKEKDGKLSASDLKLMRRLNFAKNAKKAKK